MAAAALAAPAPNPEPAAAPPPSPAPSTNDPPPSSHDAISTIRLAKKGQSLTVDGKHVKGGTVEVTCGSHTVAVGKEKPRHVDATCGHTVLVDVGKATIVKDSKDSKPTRGHKKHAGSHAKLAKRASDAAPKS
jgi:hypothetical protein